MKKSIKKAIQSFFIALSIFLPVSFVIAKPAFAWSFNLSWDQYNQLYNTNTLDTSQNNLVPWSKEMTVAIVKHFEEAFSGRFEQVQGTTNQRSYKMIQPGVAQYSAMAINTLYANPPPFSGGAYLASLNPFKPKQAYAAGTDVLNITLAIWRAFRNVAYTFSIIILTAIGFMIMFRVRVGRPGLEVTLMSMLPKIVIALILITFSYAISGFIVDIYYVSEAFFKSIISTITPAPIPLQDGTPIPYSFNVMDIFGKFGAGEFADMIKNPTEGVDFGLGWLGDALVGSIFTLAITMAFFSVMMGLFFKLIKYYASWFLLAIFSPFAFLWSAIPGQEDTQVKWFKTMITASLVFSVTYLMLNLAGYFKGVIDSAIAAGVPVGDLDTPTVLKLTPAGPAAGGVPTIIPQIIYFSIILATLNVPEAIEDALQATGFSGKGRPVDLASGLKKIPVIGGLLG